MHRFVDMVDGRSCRPRLKLKSKMENAADHHHASWAWYQNQIILIFHSSPVHSWFSESIIEIRLPYHYTRPSLQCLLRWQHLSRVSQAWRKLDLRPYFTFSWFFFGKLSWAASWLYGPRLYTRRYPTLFSTKVAPVKGQLLILEVSIRPRHVI